MAYGGYRGDPLLESLQGLGNSMRAASGDVLARRRIDLEEEAMLGRQSQERDLAGLRTLATRQQGETELLKTKANIGLQQAAERRAEAGEVRAGEMHGVSMEAGRVGIEGERFKIDRGQQLLPGEVAGQKVDNAYKRALSIESGARAKSANIEAQMKQEQLNEARREMPAEFVNQLLDPVNPIGGELFRSMHKPGEKVTMLGLTSKLNLVEKFYPGGFAEMKEAGLVRRLESNPDLPAEERVAIQEQIRNTQIQRQLNPRDGNEDIEAAIGFRTREMMNTKDPKARMQMEGQIKELMTVLGGMRLSGKAGQIPRNSTEFFNISKITKEELEWVRQQRAATRGYDLNTLDDFLMEELQIPKPEGYVTPNETYAEYAADVRPSTLDEFKIYQRGGTLPNGMVLDPNPTIQTQAQADAYKKRLHIADLHKKTGGDARLLSQRGQDGPATAPAPAQPSMSNRAAPQAPGPFVKGDRMRQEIAAQLRNTLGREPSPDEVDARFSELLGSPQGGGIGQQLGRVREFMNQNKPLDLFQGLGERLSPAARLQRLREEQERRGSSIPGTGATETQGR